LNSWTNSGSAFTATNSSEVYPQYFDVAVFFLLTTFILDWLSRRDKYTYFGEVHGTGLLMDVFALKEKANGLGIIDVVSGAYHSDRGKIRDHTLAQLYTIMRSKVLA
jgi:hypothetical protein